MKIMDDLIELISAWFEDLSILGIRTFFITFFVMLLLFLGIGSIYIYYSADVLLKKIKVLNVQLADVKALKKIGENITKIESDEQAFLAANILPAGGLKVFLEQKITAASLTPDSSWKDKSKITQWFLDPAFEEERVVLEFKTISTKQLVEFIQAVYTQPAVIIRTLDVSQKDDSLTVSLIISYRYKKT